MNTTGPAPNPESKLVSAPARRTLRMAVAAALSGVLAAATVLVATAGVAGAASSQKISDVITMTSHVVLTPPQGGVGHFVLVSDTCTLVSDGQAATPCSFVGSGTVTATGGQAQGVITSREGVILLNETYVFTGPTTTHGSGPATEIGIGIGATLTSGTFTGDFTTAPTANPNVVLDNGTITVSERTDAP